MTMHMTVTLPLPLLVVPVRSGRHNKGQPSTERGERARCEQQEEQQGQNFS